MAKIVVERYLAWFLYRELCRENNVADWFDKEEVCELLENLRMVLRDKAGKRDVAVGVGLGRFIHVEVATCGECPYRRAGLHAYCSLKTRQDCVPTIEVRG